MKQASEEDIKDLVGMAFKFWQKSGIGYQFEFDKVEKMFRQCIEQGVCIRTEQGFIAGLEMPDPYHSAWYLVELGWYCEDGRGRQLLMEFIRQGRELGVDEIRMSTLPMSKSARVLLQRYGFKEQEVSYGLKL